MGLNLLYSCSKNKGRETNIYPPDPNPFKYEVLEERIVNDKSILLVKYFGCTTFNGLKLILLKRKYLSKEPLDPHFLSESHPVLARFEPNDRGWKLAELCAKNI